MHAKLGSLSIRHSVPGHLRIQAEALRIFPAHRQTLAQQLAASALVARAEIRPLTGSVILFYDSRRVQTAELIQLVAANLGGVPQSAAVALPSCNLPRRALSSWALPKLALSVFTPAALCNVFALTGILAYSIVAKVLLKAPQPQNPGSLVGITATIGILALARQSVREIRARKRFGLNPFLTLASALAVVMGEALTAIEILWVFGIGTYVERLITEKSRQAISELLKISPTRTFMLVEGVEIETATDQVRVGDTVVIHGGERIPVDGVVAQGTALVDETHITGRAESELRTVKDHVFAGSKVVEGALFIRADKVGRDTYLSHIVRLVEDSLATRAEVENKADALASRLVRLGTLATLATLVLTQNLTRSLAVLLVMSCPCATVLATSTALAAAIASAARRGILIKGGRHLEAVQKVTALVVDKTGTITVEAPQLLAMVTRAQWQEPLELLELAANAEVGRRHPLARALLQEAENRGLAVSRDVSSEVFLGRGVRAQVGSDVVLVGSAAFLAEQNVNPAYFRAKADKFEQDGFTVIYVARNDHLQGMIVLGNQLRPGCEAVLDRLRKQGMGLQALISGDSQPVVRRLADTLGFDEFLAELRPEEKGAYVDRLEAEGRRVMMVGDGLNDALALSKATVGVAMGAGGSEVAIEAADIALLNNDLNGLVYLRQLSHQSFAVIEQNFWIATLTNLLGVGLGALGVVTPVMAGALHALHSLGIMLNSSRLLRMEFPP